MIFVFGSNKSGIHGAGAAKYALKHYGAKWGIGEGIVGNSYALPTKGFKIESMSLHDIQLSVNRFIETANYWLDRGAEFQVTRVGCGLAGYKDADIAPMFRVAPDNCHFDEYWKPWLDNIQTKRKYWGTF